MSRHVAETLTNQSQEGMVVANLLEILCPAFNLRDRDDCTRVSWIRAKGFAGKWPPSTEGVNDQDSIAVNVDFAVYFGFAIRASGGM